MLLRGEIRREGIQMTMKTGYSTLCLQNRPFGKIGACLTQFPASTCEVLNDGVHLLNKERVRFLKELGSSNNLEFTMHLPFSNLNYAATNPSLRNAARRIVLTALGHAGTLECTHAVVHSGQSDVLSAIFFPELHRKYSLDFLERLGREASDRGIQMVIENNVASSYLIHSVSGMTSFFQEDVSQYYKVALDIGHAFLTHDLDQFVQNFKGNIRYVHMHNNHGKTDDHLPLNQGKIDWRQTAKALLVNGFQGPFVIENLDWETNARSLNLLRDFLSTPHS
jgi:sugar phosphate isomerase/epimerase